jgi:hypothetical protein
LGWSFPHPIVTESPLAAGLPAKGETCPTLGVLHCDLYDSQSRYAPVRRTELEASGLDGWFLGHIHKPTVQEEENHLGYLGSVVGLDLNETGCHGPWLVTLGGGYIHKEQIPLAPLRWESVTLSVGGMEDPDTELQPLLVRNLRDLYASLTGELTETLALGCRVVLSGRLAERRQLTRVRNELAESGIYVCCGSTTVFLADLLDKTRPDHDLVTLAKGTDPPAVLAAQLLSLQTPSSVDGDAGSLIAAATEEIRQAADSPFFRWLEEAVLNPETVRQLLLQAGYEALDELLSQPKGAP